MEEDMHKLHEKHVKLLRDIDDNYKMIEEETQEQFSEFLDKWKKSTKNKIDHYKSALNSIKQDKEIMKKEMQGAIGELQERNKKLISDYEKLLEKYQNDTEAERKQNKEKAELMESAYEEEFSRLKQEKLELEGFVDVIQSQKENYESQAQELRRKVKQKTLQGQETIRAIMENYTKDCATLVISHIVDAVDLEINKEKIEKLKESTKKLEKQKEALREQVRKSSASVGPPARRLVKLTVINPKGEELKRNNNLAKEGQKLRTKIQNWKDDFEKREGRKCQRSDYTPIQDTIKELNRIDSLLEESKKLNESTTANDSIRSDTVHSKRSISPITNISDRSFVSTSRSLAKIEELKKEVGRLKAELQKARLIATNSFPETEIIRQLKEEIESLSKYKEAASKFDKSGKDDMAQLRKENERLHEKLMRLSTKSQSSLREDISKSEFEKILTENQEQQKLIKKLKAYQIQAIEVEGRFEEQEKEFIKLSDDHVNLSLECDRLKDRLMEVEELEAARLKARHEMLNSPGQDQKLKEVVVECEVLQEQSLKKDAELKSLREQINKLIQDNKMLTNKLTVLEGSSEQLEKMQQNVTDAENEIEQLRAQLAEMLPSNSKDRNKLIKADYEKIQAENKQLKIALEEQLMTLQDTKKSYDKKANETFKLKQELAALQRITQEVRAKAELVNNYKKEVMELRIQLASNSNKEVEVEMKKVIEENRELEYKCRELEEEKECYLKREAEIDLTTKELEKLKHELKKLEVEKNTLKEKAIKANSYMMERNSLREKLINTCEEDNSLYEILEENERIINSLKLTNDQTIRLQENNMRIKKMLPAITSNDLSDSGSSSKLREEIKELEDLLNKERCISEALKIESDKAAKKYDQFNEKDTRYFEEQLKKTQSQHEQELASVKKASATEIDKLSKELKAMKTETSKLKETNKNLNMKKATLEEKLQSIAKNAEYKLNEAEEAKQESRALKFKLKTYESQMLKLHNDYQDEIIQRKRLHNIIEEMKGNIRVYCRIRPPTSEDAFSTVSIVDRFTVKANTARGFMPFLFDTVFGPSATQEEVFECTKPLIQSGIDGYNVCIFAYGPTGAGKTFTIQGTETQPGIVPRSFEEMERILASMVNYSYSMECYMVELYNNILNDLLDTEDSKKNPSHLQIKEDIKKMIYIEGIKKQTIGSAKEAKEIFEKGLRNRKTSATEKNDSSSRSHLIFAILIETVNKQSLQRTIGKISFVDLAGSERAESAGNSAERLKEAGFINKSLFALNNVIAALAPAQSGLQSNFEPKKLDKSFAPYRDSKLTMLMKDSIGGNVILNLRSRLKRLCSLI